MVSKKRVTEVRLAEGVEPRPTCCLAGPLDLGGADNVAQTIKQAVQAELLAGGVYKSGGTPIRNKCNYTEAEFF